MRTDPTSPIGMFTRPVRQLSIKPVVWLAVLSTTAILACKDDPSSLGGTGRLTITVVPYEGAQAEASAAKVGPEKEEAKAARQTAAAPPRRDLVRVTVSGPEIRTLDFFPNADGSVDANISSLTVGSYSVELLGIDIDLGVESVSEYGINPSVTVLSDQTTNAVISFGSFLPVFDPTLPAATSEFAFFVDYSAVPTATGYFFELDVDPSFSAPTTVSLTGTTVIISVVALGPNWMRVRAENNSVPAAQAKPSDPVLIDVVVDINPTGDNSTTAPLLGVVRGANGKYGGYNIFPTTDEDWFAVDLVAGATLTVDVLAESLVPPHATQDLDPFVDIYDPLLTNIAFNDDRDGTTFESRVTDVPIPADGRYFIRVTSFSGATVGHYELLINVNATPVATVTVAPSTASITPGGTVQLTGRTFDASAVELFGREALWTTDDVNHATVNTTGLVTGVSVSQAAITFSSEGVTAQATITVSSGADPAQSTISGSPTSIPADGLSQSTVTVRLADALGNPVIFGGDAVTLATDLGTLGLFVFDNGNGTYSATLTAGVTPGFAAISGTVNGVAIPTGIITIRGTSPPDLIGSTHAPVSGGGTGIPISGPSALYSVDRITGGATPIGMIGFNRVGAMDVHPTTGVLYAAAERASDFTPVLITIDQTTGVGSEIGPTLSAGAISDLTFHSDGTLYGHDGTPGFHRLLRFSLTTGAGTLVGNTGVGGGGNGLTFNATNSLFLAGFGTLYALNTATGSGTNLGLLTFSNLGCDRVKAVDRDPATGVLYAALECGATDALGTLEITAGTATFIGSSVANLDGLVVPGTSTAPTTGPASALLTTISTFNNNIVADGVATADIIVFAKDATDTQLSVGGDHLALSTTLGTLSVVTDNGDGTYTATLTSSTTAGTATVSGTINGVAISSTQGITSIALLGSAHTSGGPATLYWIDPATGGAGVLGAIGFDRVGAIAKHPATGVFYAAAQRPAPDGTPVLITVNPVTGAGTEVGPTGVSGSVTDMSFRSDGTLFLFDGPTGGYNLHTVNLTTGAATAVGATSLSGGGLAMWFDAANVLHLATTFGSTVTLYTISTTTAVPTMVGLFTYTGAACASPVMNAADYDPVSGNTYATVRCFAGPSITAFATVDVGILTINVIGGTVDRVDGLVTRR